MKWGRLTNKDVIPAVKLNTSPEGGGHSFLSGNSFSEHFLVETTLLPYTVSQLSHLDSSY